MKIHTKVIYEWSEASKQYVKVLDDWYSYLGAVELACGASQQQQNIGQQQSNFYNQMTAQATQVFGNSSQVFSSLMNTFSPIVAAGPSQQGFSPQELSNLNSQAITQTGQAYQHDKAAVGNAEAATGGGNVALPSGAQIGTNLGLAESAANQTSGELSQITQANYATGRQNYENAVTGMEQAPNVFGAATNAASAATGAGEAASNTANQIAQENNSWVNATIGALGSVAGAAAEGYA